MWEGLVSGGFGSFRFLVTTLGEKLSPTSYMLLFETIHAFVNEYNAFFYMISHKI